MRPAVTKTTRQDKQTKSNNKNKHLQPKLKIYFEKNYKKNKVKTLNKTQTMEKHGTNPWRDSVKSGRKIRQATNKKNTFVFSKTNKLNENHYMSREKFIYVHVQSYLNKKTFRTVSIHNKPYVYKYKWQIQTKNKISTKYYKKTA